jgi:hypothetical protein
MAIGEIAIGDPAGVAAAPAAAASAVNAATKADNVANSFLKSDTIKAIKGGIETVLKLYESTSAALNDIQNKRDGVTDASKGNLTTTGGDVSGDNQSNANLAAIYGLATWDDWIL